MKEKKKERNEGRKDGQMNSFNGSVYTVKIG